MNGGVGEKGSGGDEGRVKPQHLLHQGNGFGMKTVAEIALGNACEHLSGRLVLAKLLKELAGADPIG